MTYTIEYSKEADRTLRKWKKSNPQLFKKATKILLDIMQHPRTGLGHPEAQATAGNHCAGGTIQAKLHTDWRTVRGFTQQHCRPVHMVGKSRTHRPTS